MHFWDNFISYIGGTLMKNFVLIFSLLFSFSALSHYNERDLSLGEDDGSHINLNGSRVHLGYLEGEMGMPFHKELVLVRTPNTPKKVTMSFFYTQIEMICEDRVPDGGYGNGYGHYNYNNKNNRTHFFGGGYHGDHGGNHRGNDRNFMGICRRWTTMETEKSGRVGLFFKKSMKGDQETLKVMITARDRHSTSVFFDAEMLTPSRKYKKKRMNSRAIMFK